MDGASWEYRKFECLWCHGWWYPGNWALRSTPGSLQAVRPCQLLSATSGDAAVKNHLLYCLVRVLGVSAGHSWLHRLTAGGNNEETGEIIPLHPSNPSTVLESCLAIASPSLFPPPSWKLHSFFSKVSISTFTLQEMLSVLFSTGFKVLRYIWKDGPFPSTSCSVF